MNRLRAAAALVSAVAFAYGVLVWLAQGGPWWLLPIYGVNGALAVFWTKEWKKHGHRQGTRDRDDSGTREVTVSAFPGTVGSFSVTLGPFSGTSLTYGSRSGRAGPLPRREGDLPILAWKHAHIARAGRTLCFDGCGVGGRYVAVDEAHCNGGQGYTVQFSHYSGGGWSAAEPQGHHKAPDENCSCGFYALKERPDDVQAAVLLEVELYGEVIVAEKGYRAEWQRVLAIHAGSCEFCPGRASTFVVPQGYDAGHRDEPLAPRCGDHVGPQDVPISFDNVSTALEVPVR